MSFYDAERFAYRPQAGGFAPYGAQPASPVPGYITGPAPGMQGMVPPVPAGTPVTSTGVAVPGALPPGRVEESYVENILRLNLGKTATIYMTYENNVEWNAKIFKGRLEAAGRDHIIISDPTTGKRYLLLTVNLDYITFDEPLNYFHPPGVPLPR
ncbi:spore coat protein GerQ [Gorillibacterium timonense]|uniref:spore coat protein GerQ n=1 Tax=Gorillibacterium timonense TaxID=1689269 RepID=UPI0009EC253A|nr:spore coat protein GerQ [Gorillibacterium timonense]